MASHSECRLLLENGLLVFVNRQQNKSVLVSLFMGQIKGLDASLANQDWDCGGD